MPHNQFDPNFLTEKGRLWRVEAATATIEAVRAYCISQAEYCDQLVRASMETPVFSEPSDAARARA